MSVIVYKTPIEEELIFWRIWTNIKFFRNSSLHKQPFITAHFRSSLHIFCINAR